MRASSHCRRGRLLATVSLCAFVLPAVAALADESAPQQQQAPTQQAPVQQVVVTEQKSAVPDNVPSTTETFSKQQIEDSVNAMTSAEVLKYLPSVAVRERYIGDRNGILSTRTTGTVAAAQSMVYADDLLLSNLLGNNYSYPPRWGMVSPGEIERVDMLYGPFSAAYPGNSFGGVAVMTTRMPDKAEAHVDLKGFNEGYKNYGTDKNYSGYDGNVALGSRYNALSFWVDADHLDSHGHPMQFATANQSTTVAGASLPKVTGTNIDSDPSGNKRLIFGATSIDHTIQDMGKVKVAYDIDPDVRLTYTLGLWENASHTSVDSYLTDSAGNPLYNGAVNVGGYKYNVSMNPTKTQESHIMNGLSLKSDTKGLFDYDLSASNYRMLQEQNRSASNYGANNIGTDQHMDGTGWENADLRGIWRPMTNLAGKHEVSFGYHIDRYELAQSTFNNTNWENGADGSFNSSSFGKTQTQGLYLQDAWTFHPDWTLTMGARQEYWDAFDGMNGKGTTNVAYADRSQNNISPKASLAYQVTTPLSERFSVGKAYRYPTVSELFQAVSTGNTLLTNDPNLKPEDVTSYEWATEYQLSRYDLRLSLFQEDRHNAIVSQTDQSVTGSSTTTVNENVDQVRSRGVEMAARTTGFFLDKLDVMGSVTFVQSRTLRDSQYAAATDKHFPNIPTWRAKMVADYHQSEDLTFSTGFRYASRAYSTLNNSDFNGNTYGGTSELMAMDARVTYKLGNGFTAALGVDNAFGNKAYVYHPYPQTTVFGQLKYDY